MPVATKKPKRIKTPRKTHKEHLLFAETYVQDQLTVYAARVKAWRLAQVPAMHENVLAAKIGISGQHVRNIESGVSAPSYAVAVAIFRETGIQPIDAPVLAVAD
jgi:ribosome-binding protein aMBF1 (putative translation factor)